MRILLIFLLIVQFGFSQQILLRQPIQRAIETENFLNFITICKEKVSVNFEEPFRLNGYFYKGRFIDVFSQNFSKYEIRRLEWSTKQIEENFAIQSLNLVLKHKKSEKIVYYKFIFFMTRDEVDIVKFNETKSYILFERDPKWVVNSEFEVTGTVDGKNDGWYKIVRKNGHLYVVKKITGPMVKVFTTGPGGRAKAWKLYYLRGLRI